MEKVKVLKKDTQQAIRELNHAMTEINRFVNLQVIEDKKDMTKNIIIIG